MHYVLGLDIGITSVGWAVLELNIQDEPIRIIAVSYTHLTLPTN